jgi:hypothetical protein
MPNHLVVGLGGNGGKMIRSFRKLIYQNHRVEDPPGVSIRYLYVDSSAEMMGDDDPTWKILGTSVQLRKNSQLHIKGMNLNQVLDNLGDYPGIGPWLGSREQFRTIIMSADAANVVGGQKRRLGRFLFACKAGEFRSQVQALVREMQTGAMVETVFHVCSGLAGGTGSGSIIDVICQIRSLYPDTTRFKIIIYALLPELDPVGQRAGANYHANGYAALLELNALAVGAYQPYDVSGVNPGRMTTLSDPFNCCYLFTDENEAGNRVDIDTELPDIVGSFLYQKIVAVKVNDFTWDSLRRQESFETGTQAKSTENSPGTGKPERCRLFFSFGVKQIAYPEEEIRELLTYEFARQAALQLRFNNWSDSSGYVEEASNQSFEEFVTQKETLENWRITDEHLCLSLGILPDEIANRRWKSINAYWNELLPNFQSDIRETYAGQEKVWMAKLLQKCEDAYSKNYRELGVPKFYQTKIAGIPGQVREIRRRIETELFADWKNGARSMHDISRLLDALVGSLTQRCAVMDDKTAQSRDNETTSEATIEAYKKEWAGIGAIHLPGSHNRVFEKQAVALAEYNIHRTRTLGWQHAKKILESLSAELTSLASDVAKAASTITEATEEFKRNVAVRCKDGGQSDMTKQVVRFYDPKTVDDFARRLIRNKAEQLKQTNAVRQAIGALLGDDQNQKFSTFNAKIDSKEKFIGVLEKTCVNSAEDAHNSAISNDPNLNRILRVNIVDRLAKEFGQNKDALRRYVLDVVSRARTFLAMNSAEVGRAGPGIPRDQTCVSYFTIILPDAENKDFRAQLARELQDARTGEKDSILIKDTGQNNNRGKGKEITLVNITNVFPARFARDAAFLRQKYEGRLGTGSFELHSEGDGQQFPSLYVRSATPRDVFPYLLIAKAMNAAQQLEDPETGISSIYLLTKNERGRDNPPILLGTTIGRAAEEATGEIMDQLESLTTAGLAGDYLNQKKRDDLLVSIHADLDALREQVKNPLDRRYKAYLDAANKAEEILNRR